MPFGRLEDVSLAERAYQVLREAILTMALRPGENLVEQKLADALGISKTPIRQALHQLTQTGLVVSLPNKGYAVSQLTLRDAWEILVIRAELEALATRLACPRLDDEALDQLENLLAQQRDALASDDPATCAEIGHQFHRVLMKHAENARLTLMIQILNDQFHRIRLLSSHVPGRLPHSIEEHARVLKALRDGDSSRAAELMRTHMLEVYTDVERDKALASIGEDGAEFDQARVTRVLG